MPPWHRAYVIWLCLSSILKIQADEIIPPRKSCRSHYLAGQSVSRILPLRLNDGVQSNVLCEMPTSPNMDIVTVFQSGLHKPYEVVDKQTISFQIRDFDHLRDILRKSHCQQNVTITWADPRDGSDLTTISALGVSTTFQFSDEINGRIETTLEGDAAAILHLLPKQKDPYSAPKISASEIRCSQRIDLQPHCLLNSGESVEISISTTDEYFEFAFRTDRLDQSLFDVYLNDEVVSHYRLEEGFFFRISGEIRYNVGLLADGRWHTVKFRPSSKIVEIDSQHVIKQDIKLEEAQVTKIVLKVDGQVILTHPVDENNECIESARLKKSDYEMPPRQFCWDEPSCSCTILPNYFDSLPSSACKHKKTEEDHAYHLLRVPELLSFLYIPDRLNSENIRSAMSFRSDADSGLLMFGAWKNEDEWGRFQVHYHGEKLSALYCTQSETSDEQCSGCAIFRIGGFSNDQWSRVAFFKDAESYYLLLDREICQLSLVTEENEFDTAEMYKTLLTRGSVLFIGGMFHKKVKPGIYKEDFKLRYFENTREKLPSLKGCIKDIFVNAYRINLHEEFNNQMMRTLVTPSRYAYGVKRGCGVCEAKCPDQARCRPSTNTKEPEFMCDCADIYKYGQLDGTCTAPKQGVLSLASGSLNAYRSLFSLPRVSGTLHRMWLKLKLPTIHLKDNTPLVTFYSYGRIIFRIFMDTNGMLNVQANPLDPDVFSASAGKHIVQGDERIHLIKFERRTPLGTHPSRRFFNLFIDGDKYSVQDPNAPLTAIEFSLINTNQEREAGCITDFGISYDYDEHSGGVIQQNDIKALMMNDLGLLDSNETCGIEDPYLWIHGPQDIESSPFGNIHDYTPNGRPETAFLFSPNLMFFSFALTCLLVLLILLCLIVYCCLLKKNTKKLHDEDIYPDSKLAKRIIRRRSDEYPVMLRRETIESNRDSYISDSLDNSDIRAYDDIRTHKVKIDRESMISFLDPVSEESRVAERRTDENAPLVRLREMI